MSIFSKARVKAALTGMSKFELSHQHITTGDFMQLNCALIYPMVPKQKISLDMDTFTRLAPVSVPTFGKVDIHHHAFFVPYRTIMPSWNDFITDAVHTSNNSGTYGIVPFAHRVSLELLTQVLATNPVLSSSTTTAPSSYDATFIRQVSSSETSAYYTTFKPRGRQVYKVLRQLGYCLQPNISQSMLNNPTYVSALPLLAFVRVYLDYYYPSQYVGDSDYNLLLQCLQHDPSTGYTLTADEIGAIFLFISNVCYDADYFTAAFDNPNGPNLGLASSVSIPDIGSVSSQTLSSSSATTSYVANSPVVGSSGAGNNLKTFSQYAIDSLRALSSYMKRHQLAGSRALDRYLARFGVSLSPEVTNRSYYIGKYVVPVDFGAVMSNSDTEGAGVGYYAGQGYAFGNGHFEFEANEKEYGVFMILTSIVPKVGYVQGIDRNILHLSKLDFFTPEFDALGCQAIAGAELYVDDLNESQNESVRDDIQRVFGFTPRYAEYKTKQDRLTGDYLLRRRNRHGISSDAWHSFRLFDQDSAPLAHNKSFIMPDLNGDATQYNRFFDYQGTDADHFPMVHNFRMTSYMPARPLFDTFNFDDEHGKTMDIEAGGVRVN